MLSWRSVVLKMAAPWTSIVIMPELRIASCGVTWGICSFEPNFVLEVARSLRFARRLWVRRVISVGLAVLFLCSAPLGGARVLGRLSVAHGEFLCGINLLFDNSLAIVTALHRVRLVRWVLA